MKPTNNGNCKNGDSGHYHHYWRCKKSALHTGWLIFRSRFFKQNHRKNISEFWVVFPQFFFICTARAAWKTEEKWLNSTPPWNEFCGVDNTHSMNPNTRKSLKKKKISIGSLCNNPWIFWPFHALWQSYRKSTKKVAFSMPVIKFLLSFDINHRKRMCDVSWIIKGWLWLFSSFQCSLSSPKVSMSEGVIWQLSYCRFYLYVGNVWKKLQSKMVLENMHRIIIIIQGVTTSYG